VDGCEIPCTRGAAIGPDDLVDGDWVRVHGKGGKVAMVPLTAAARAIWVDRPWPMTTPHLSRRVVDAMRHAGISGHSAHSLRRTCATRLSAKVPPHVVAALLRHNGVANLRHYQAVSPEELLRAVA
jgi:integrase